MPQVNRVVTDNRGFYQTEKDATMEDEVSLSHLLRKRNSFVRNGWSYGEALGHFILDKGLVPWKAPRIVEVGGGLGDLAASLIPVLEASGKRPDYTILDLSPRLLEAQRRRLGESGVKAGFVLGDGERLQGYAGGYELLLSNEVIGDFRVIDNVPLERDGAPTGPDAGGGGRRAWGLAWDMIDKYGLDVPEDGAVPSFAVNWGAIRFAETLWQTMPAGGAAFVVENSSPYAEPVRVAGHAEYSVSELHLGKVFRKLGFEAAIGNVNDFLWVSPEARMADEQHVNLWLKLGFDPYDHKNEAEVDAMALGMGGRHPKPGRRRGQTFDEAMTRQEYSEHAGRMGWALAAPKSIPVPTDDVSYFMLRKPSDVDVEPKRFSSR
jgi:hypothetical protein